jgi:colanic acid biosynthesis glycosyl transferase WcaI
MSPTAVRPVKILIYSLNFAPELTGIGRYNSEMARWLQQHGHAVRVIAAPPYYPAWAVAEPYRAWSYTVEDREGVEVLRCPIWVPSNPTGWRRIAHLASFALSSLAGLWRCLGWRPDVVLVTEPPLACAPGALAFCGISGARSWLHVQDLEIDAGFGLGFMKRPWLRKLVSRAERLVLRRFDRVTTISTGMRNVLASRVDSDQEVGLMRNWVDTDAVRPVDGSRFRVELGIAEGDIVCMYSGSMAAKQGLDILADVIERLRDRLDIHFVLCGTGASRAELEARVGQLPRVHFLELQPAERLAELLSTADVHLLPQRADVDGFVMPSKLCGIFASARPVVVTARPTGELAQLVAEKGVVVPPGDDEAFSNAIVSLAADPVRRHVLGLSARAYAEGVLDIDAVLSHAFDSLDAVSVPDGEEQMATARTIEP